MATVHMDPIPRIEGHFAAEVDTDADYEAAPSGHPGHITDVQMKGEMYRGFENILKGRHCGDALTITQRI